MFFAALSWAAEAMATGFGLYEPSAKAHALGGAAYGRAADASANFINPATLTDLTNATVTVGFVTEHPRARMKVDGHTSTKMDPGAFVLPHFHLSVPLPWDFVFGFGMMPEYGLGSEYVDNWGLEWNSLDTTVISATANPNLAYRVTDRWSVGAGLRFLYFDFEQHSRPMAVAGGVNHGVLRSRLKGDNGMQDFGGQVGTSYRLLDNLSLGATYKTRTIVNVSGKSQCHVLDDRTGYAAQVAAAVHGHAKTKLELPQSVGAGLNWDVTDRWHLGAGCAWTQWSTVDELKFHLGSTTKPIKLHWEDSWRVSVAPSWDFAEDWTAMASYIYETDCCNRQESTMLPPTERHLLTWGLAWRPLKGLELALSYGLVLMDGGTTRLPDALGQMHSYSPHRGLSHAAGFSVSYLF